MIVRQTVSDLLVIGGPNHGETAYLQELEWDDGRIEVICWYGVASCAMIVQSSVAETCKRVLATMTHALQADALIEELNPKHREFLNEILKTQASVCCIRKPPAVHVVPHPAL